MKPNALRIGMRVRYVPRHASRREQTETGEVVTWRHHQGEPVLYSQAHLLQVVDRAVADAVAKEREACAKHIEELPDYVLCDREKEDIATRLRNRARGKETK